MCEWRRKREREGEREGGRERGGADRQTGGETERLTEQSKPACMRSKGQRYSYVYLHVPRGQKFCLRAVPNDYTGLNRSHSNPSLTDHINQVCRGVSHLSTCNSYFCGRCSEVY